MSTHPLNQMILLPYPMIDLRALLQELDQIIEFLSVDQGIDQ